MKAYIVESAELRKNLDNIKKRAGSAVIYAVLKGNGYGLGLIPMAAACRDAGITRYAVTEVSDVAALRQCGFPDEEILMLRPTADSGEVRQLLALNAVFTVSSQEDAAVLNGVASQENAVAKAHIKIDTGMGRYGFLPEEMDKILSVYSYMDHISVTGIYTHLHSAFCNKKQTLQQADIFQGILKAITSAGLETGLAHISNSAALLRFPELTMGGVRIGSALLGRLCCKGGYGLKRIGYCEATVEELRWLPKGHTCGYGAAWTARRPTRVAVLSVGWYHGFGCEMGNDIFRPRDCLRKIFSGLKGLIIHRSIYVTVNGKRCRVLGHIGMLHTVCDVTSISCSLGDKAVVNINPLMLKGMDVVWR